MSAPSLATSPSPASEALALDRAQRKQAAACEAIRRTGKSGSNALGAIQDTALAREAFDMGEAYRQAQIQR